MNNHALDYMYSDSDSARALKRLISVGHIRDERLSVVQVDDGTVLPSRRVSGSPILGLGGVVRADGTYVEESSHSRFGVRVFGGNYESARPPQRLDEAVIYLGPISWHWGNFLFDYLARLWYLLDRPTAHRIVYCGSHLDEGSLGPNQAKFLEVFSLLNIRPDQLLDVRRPTVFGSIAVPEPAYEPGASITPPYRAIFERIAENVESALPGVETHSYPSRIYFTRTGFAQRKEVGEGQIEALFSANGYAVVSPESFSVASQVAMIRNCNEMVSMDGTVAHSIMFAKASTSQVILRKQSQLNLRQIAMNELVGNPVAYVDVFREPLRRFPRSHDDGPFWVGVSAELLRFAADREMSVRRARCLPLVDSINFVRYLGMCGAVEARHFLNRLQAHLRRTLPMPVVSWVQAWHHGKSSLSFAVHQTPWTAGRVRSWSRHIRLFKVRGDGVGRVVKT